MVVDMRLLKHGIVLLLIVISTALVFVLTRGDSGFALPEDYCVPVYVDARYRSLAARYGIPVNDKPSYTLVVARPIAFGKRGYQVRLSTVLPSSSSLFPWRGVDLRDTNIYANADEAMREAAEWWAGCR